MNGFPCTLDEQNAGFYMRTATGDRKATRAEDNGQIGEAKDFIGSPER